MPQFEVLSTFGSCTCVNVLASPIAFTTYCTCIHTQPFHLCRTEHTCCVSKWHHMFLTCRAAGEDGPLHSRAGGRYSNQTRRVTAFVHS